MGPFIEQPVEAARAMLERNCSVPMQLCHHFARSMVQRGRGGIVILGSGAALAGSRNMVAYGATKAFDMVFAEALWTELAPQGVDVLGLILADTDTPALRRMRYLRGLTADPREPARGATPVRDVVREALANIDKGPTHLVSWKLRIGSRLFSLLSRNAAVRLFTWLNGRVMGEHRTTERS
ncbi:MAG: SDR family NAD(P)-dependent oxidoreductase [Deinococcales bacterium]